eukprot:CAMPEP_0172649348 /NCGR_PEP_ID=MMETSP1068-20121228/241742_1 /TAXON_ID=35684 /ORGANISM="Pseudopedinella elastica, Strain CCMP716" /LENGTH=362 /DNA_ID=CAMNT_0013463697 /DNA_START=29 /DNA_END=1117 /DNA_ORIENTATION=+
MSQLPRIVLPFAFVILWTTGANAFVLPRQQRFAVNKLYGTADAYKLLETYVRRSTLRELLPPSELAATVASLREDKELWESYRPTYEKAVKRAEKEFREESRTFKEILGEDASERLLKALEEVAGDADATQAVLRTPAVEGVMGKKEEFILLCVGASSALEEVAGDADATQAVLRTPAVEGVIGSVLYEGIFQFIQTVDIIGNIVNGLPVIGPIRQQILNAFKKELDRTLGRQVKSFLGSYTRAASEQVANLVLSEENSKGFANARRRLGEEVLNRPLNSLVPPESTVDELSDAAWNIAASPLPIGDEEVINRVYDAIGNYSLDGLGIETPPQISALATKTFERFLNSDEGKVFTEKFTSEK